VSESINTDVITVIDLTKYGSSSARNIYASFPCRGEVTELTAIQPFEYY
jgi:hypothetical protein